MNPLSSESNPAVSRERAETLARLPSPWPHDVLPRIREELGHAARTLVVLDDDPTGTQTVHDVPVLTEWSVDALAREFSVRSPLFFVLTNSRSLAPERAESVNREIAAHLGLAAGLTHRDFAVVSRSDSTLRGHFPLEMDVLARELGWADAPWILVPYFDAGGRLTLDEVHYIVEGETLVPVGDTPFARDASFGFRASNLCEWIEEKTAGRIPADTVASISLDELRRAGPDRVHHRLTALPARGVCVVNAVAPRDLEVFVLGLLRAERGGRRFLYRTAASFVAARAGFGPLPLLRPRDLAVGGRSGGLVVVGSHVPKTTQQLDALLAAGDVAAFEADVGRLLGTGRAEEIARIVNSASTMLAAGRDTAIYTSRSLTRGTDKIESLSIGRVVSEALVEIVAGLRGRPRYLIAKGGITSSDIATKALGVRRARVGGQILPGIPVWNLGAESRWPDLTYVVFPGNVGGRDALAQVVQALAHPAGVR